MAADDLRTLARGCGVELTYRDNFGRERHAGRETLEALLTAMGVPCGTSKERRQSLRELRARLYDRFLPPVAVVTGDKRQVNFHLRWPLPNPPEQVEVAVELREDTGARWAWEAQVSLPSTRNPEPVEGGYRWPLSLALPAGLPPGYYDLQLRVRSPRGEETGETRLVVAPPQAYFPAALARGARWWGLNIPLYALKSRHNWGIGDFRDLKAITSWAGEQGAAFVGVNPLHARTPRPGADPSPYAPSSRLFLNFLYIHLETVPEAASSPAVRTLLAHPAFQAHLARLRETPLVAYPEVYRLKHRVLRLLFAAFAQDHGLPGTPCTPRGEEFARFVAQGGKNLADFALFQALEEARGEADWRRWPASFHHPDAPAAAAFAREHPRELAFQQYVQWLATGQREEVWAQAVRAGLPFTLYQDLALGAAAGGFETWAYRGLFSRGAAMGAPPDAFNPEGQNWGLPPLIPLRLAESGYRLFIDTLRANLPPWGLVRLDHVMSLFRLFWIPPGLPPGDGAYVRYPAGDLLAILALESHRRHTLVIGEDLGTVAPCIRRELAKAQVLSYRVFYFEREADDRFKEPDAYPQQAIAAVTTHDLPTLAGYWQGCDLDLKRNLHRYPRPEDRRGEVAAREAERRRLVAALVREKLLPKGVVFSPRQCPPGLRLAVLKYLARSRAALLEVRLEDALGLTCQQNLPGTTSEHPNWRRKIPLPLVELCSLPELVRLARKLTHLRPVASHPFPPRESYPIFVP